MNKNSDEGRALDKIWRFQTKEQRELLRDEFYLLARYIPDGNKAGEKDKTAVKKEPVINEGVPQKKRSNNTLKVGENCSVKMLDLVNDKEVEFEVIPQTKKTHYLESRYYRGERYFKQEQVLDQGGDGISTISLESPLGMAIEGKEEGDVVVFMNPSGGMERYEILSISK